MSINLVRVKNSSGEEVHVLRDKSVVNFGRDKRTCHVAFDPQLARVSRVHASLEWTEDAVLFTDKSKEGTTVNGEKIKQTTKMLCVGVHHVQIGGIPITVEVEGDELDETIPDSVDNEPLHESSFEKEFAPSTMVDEEQDEVGSVSTIGFSKKKSERKRKSDASLFEENQPRVKRGPTVRKLADFDEEMENRDKKGPRARKADERGLFDSETPAKKQKPSWEPVPTASQRLMMKNKPKSPSPDIEDDVLSIVSKVAAMPTVSSETKNREDDLEIQMDRGPAPPNETIKYANLVFQQHLNKKQTVFDPAIPNFKRFKPKNGGDGRASVTSMFSNTTVSSSRTISLVDARRMH